jgi:hypothetical protein
VDTPLNQYSGICLLASDIRIAEGSLYSKWMYHIQIYRHIFYTVNEAFESSPVFGRRSAHCIEYITYRKRKIP